MPWPWHGSKAQGISVAGLIERALRRRYTAGLETITAAE